MNTGQTLLTIGTISLLSAIVLSVYDSILHNDNMLSENQFGTTVTSLGQAIIEDRISTDFDSIAVGIFEDTLSTPIADFPYTLQVGYVQENFPDNFVVGPTAFKKMAVTLSSQYLAGDVTLDYIFSDY